MPQRFGALAQYGLVAAWVKTVFEIARMSAFVVIARYAVCAAKARLPPFSPKTVSLAKVSFTPHSVHSILVMCKIA